MPRSSPGTAPEQTSSPISYFDEDRPQLDARVVLIDTQSQTTQLEKWATSMRYVLIVMTAILAIAGLAIGSAHVFGGLVGYAEFSGNGDLGTIAESPGYEYHDNASRFLGGIFFSIGLGFLYCLYNLSDKTQLFRFLLFSIFVGGIARIIGWYDLGVTETTIAATAIELVFPPIMLVLQGRVHSQND